jgi:hypothetical protein
MGVERSGSITIAGLLLKRAHIGAETLADVLGI